MMEVSINSSFDHALVAAQVNLVVGDCREQRETLSTLNRKPQPLHADPKLAPNHKWNQAHHPGTSNSHFLLPSSVDG